MLLNCWNVVILLLLYCIRNHLSPTPHITKKTPRSKSTEIPFSSFYNTELFNEQHEIIHLINCNVSVCAVCAVRTRLYMSTAVFHYIFIIITLHFFYYLTKSKIMWNIFTSSSSICFCCRARCSRWWFWLLRWVNMCVSFLINWVIYYEEKQKKWNSF